MSSSSSLFLLSLFYSLSFLLLVSSKLPPSSPALPLSTSSRWIVDGAGRRVKLACANWAAHLEPVVVEGLGKSPLDAISKQVAALGFNCVRLTWPLHLLTSAPLGSLTVRQSLLGLGLVDTFAGVAANNRNLLELSLIQAYQAVVSNLASNNIMVILDNHITKPGWCCSENDGNGFFGDEYFNPDEWLHGLKLMATMFNGSSNVIGMSLRNELRGSNLDLTLWYRYMQRGAEVVHAANPGLLVILSGLDYDKDLSFLSAKPVQLSFCSKIVFELHWYSFFDSDDWKNGNPDKVCAKVVGDLTTRGLFLLEQGWPVFFSEFGVDQSGANMDDNRFLSCFFSLAAQLDFDWAVWALQGSYYVREGTFDYDESYGVLSKDWVKARNDSFVRRLSALQSPFQGPGLSVNEDSYNVIFHPLTGLCVNVKSPLKPLELGPCEESKSWNYTKKHNLILKGGIYFLQAVDVGKPLQLGISCGGCNSKWKLFDDSRMRISSEIHKNGSTATVCLDATPDKGILTNTCTCLSNDWGCSQESQWFKIIKSNREL